MKQVDLQVEKYIINKYISITKLFDEVGIDYRTDSNFYCPFHDNVNTPSAHLYNDENGSCIWCFSEGRIYRPYNVYKQFMCNINTNKLACMILNSLPKELQDKELYELNIEEDLDLLPYTKDLIKFKQHKIDISNLLEIIANSYIDDI